MRTKLLLAYRLLYITYGLFPIITGIDKFFDYLTDWHIYLNLAIPSYLNVSPTVFMHSMGVIEILTGLLVFWKPNIGGYIIAIILVGISINLITMGSHTHEGYAHVMTHYDIALRDLVMAIGAYALVLIYQELNESKNAQTSNDTYRTCEDIPVNVY